MRRQWIILAGGIVAVLGWRRWWPRAADGAE
jgi:hypothetical protein